MQTLDMPIQMKSSKFVLASVRFDIRKIILWIWAIFAYK